MKIYSAQLKGTTTVATGSNVSLTGSFSGSIAGIDINATNQFTASTSTRLTNIEIISASNINRITSLETKSASVDISISNINAVTASNIARLSNLETKSSSVDISVSNINSFTASNGNTSLNLLTGSLATTGSNSFFGTQVFSGSVFIANDLVVQGSSSIQYISASSVSIGTNIVQLNTANPSVRFAGLTMIDSGSVGGSGSFLYDSLQDEFIFVHRGNGTNVTSSHFVTGPETYDSLGNETYLTTNILTKGTGKEHLVDSCIFDNGTTTCIKNNLIGTGTITGTTIYGSTAVCSAVGFFSGCVGIGTTVGTAALGIGGSGAQTTANLTDGGSRIGIIESIPTGGEAGNGGALVLGSDTWGNGAGRGQIALKALLINGSGCGTSDLAFSLRNDPSCSNLTERMRITSAGIACFACQVCAGSFYTTGNSCFGGKFSVNATIDSEAQVRINAIGNTTNTITCSTALRLSTSNNTAGQGISIALTAGSTKETGIILAAENTSGQNGDFLIRTYAGGANYPERFRLTSAGNVGIGTCTPTDKLHVLGADNGITICSITANRPVFNFINGSTSMLKLSANATYGAIASCTGDLMYFYGSNVGIGTTTPAATLNVSCVPSSYFGIIETTGTSTGTVKHFRVHKPNCVEYGIGILDTNAFHISTASTFPTSNGFTMLSGGNIGFGETTPGTDRLVILGNNTHNNVWLRLKTAGCHGIKPAIHFDSGLNGTNYASKVIIMGGYSSPDSGAGGALVIYTNDTNETSQQRMCIDPRGAVTIMGALAKGSGSFRICHPLSSKVKTHALVHSFIEGPNADLIYSGHSKLTNGIACINIDCSARMTQGTFEALNRCVRIFTTNETSWDAVRGKVCGNMVVIESQNTNSEDEISWMVIGERHDQHMFDTEWTDTEGRVITEPELVIINDDDIK